MSTNQHPDDLEYDELTELLYELIDDPHNSAMSPEAFLDHLHGRTTESNQQLVLMALQEGFVLRKLGQDEVTVPFVEYCLLWSNDELIRQVVEAGPPPGFELPKVPSNYAALPPKSQWLDHLCGYDHTVGSNRSVHRSDVYGALLDHLGPSSVHLLRYAHSLAPDHPGIASPNVRSMLRPRFPGNLHYALLHVALNGTIHRDDVFVRARTVKQNPPAESEISHRHHDAALQCLEYLREAGVPIRLNDWVALDAQPFAMACGLGARHDVVMGLMRAYIDAGVLDIDAPLHHDHQDVGGAIPLDAAIYAGGPAAAFIDLGCNIDRADVCQPLRAAQQQGRPETAAEVVAALMRRKIAECDTPKGDDPVMAPGVRVKPRRSRAVL